MTRSEKETFGRRDFLIECGRVTAAAALIPVTASVSPGFSSAGLNFEVHPRYREQNPLEAVLAKRSARFDDFVTEKYHDQIAAILSQWSENLLRSPQRTGAIARVLAPDFRGFSPRPSGSRVLRPKGALEVRQLSFNDPTISREEFETQLRRYLADFSQILTADFQVTGIDERGAGQVLTRVRYELVGTGTGFYREQRVGHWELNWQAISSGEFRLKQWTQANEVRSRSISPLYDDLTQYALGANSSYSAQLLHGSDYWRTVLDAACRIDIYGHNGVSVVDIDGDGFDDLYVCQPAGLPNRLYRNRGDGTFEDLTEASGLGVLENTACAIFADFDNDGLQDVIIVRANGPLLFINEGDGRFREKPDAFQFAAPPQGTFTGAAAADYDRDGWLDIYFCLYVYYQGTDQYKYPTPYFDANNGPPNFLMRNNRNGTFGDVTAKSGLNQNNTRYSFCCVWTDSNNDGWPDLYIVNDFGRKNLYRNNGNGTFTDVADQAGVEDVGAGMSICSFDYDREGVEDLYVADMWTAAGERITAQKAFKQKSAASVRALYQKHSTGNSLFRNAGNGRFQDRTKEAGVGMGRWSWSSDTWDFDHDGFPDLYITNGMISGPVSEDLNSFFWRQVVAKSPDEPKPGHDYEQGWNAINELIRADYSWSGFERNVFYANNRDGTFSDVSGAIGLDFLEDGRSFALADFDHDGRLEVVVKNRNAPQLRLLKNMMKDLPPSISFRLRGTTSNRDAIGAAITLETEFGQQTRMLQAGSGFLSQHSKEIFFGLGDAKHVIKASVRWPSGYVQSLSDLPPNYRIYVTEGVESYRANPFQSSSKSAESQPQPGEALPNNLETWLLTPVAAPDFSLPATGGTIHALTKLRGKPALLYFWSAASACCEQNLAALGDIHKSWADQGLQLLTVRFDGSQLPYERNLSFPVLIASDDMAAVYNILYRWLFDRHRDLSLPASLLLNEQGEIVKLYQGSFNIDHVQRDFRQIPRSNADRIAKALPFAGNAGTFAFGRNFLSLGSTYFQRGYFEEAGDSFQLALRDDPASAEANYGLGSVYLKQSKAPEARACFEAAVKLDASYPDTKANAWNNLGLLATQDNKLDQAIGFFQEALRLNPDHLISLENLGNAYRQEKRWDEARTTLQRALELAPINPEVNYSLGMVFAQTDQPERAYEYLHRALQLRPIYPEAMNNLGVLYLRMLRRDDAVAEFEKCIRLAPAFDQPYLNLARVYVIESNPDKARATLLALLKQHPQHAQAQRALQELK